MKPHLTLVPVVLGLLAMALFSATGCAPKSQDADSIQVKGSDTLLHLATEWAEAFMKKNPGKDVAVTGGGSGTGIAALLNGHCNLANSSRPIKQKELDMAKEKGLEVKGIDVARDGISVIVHPSNGMEALSMDQLSKIFTGEVTNWKDLGGADMAIVVLSRDHSSGTHAFFKECVLNKKEYTQKAKFVQSNSAIVASVSEDKGAVGYVGLGYYENAKDKVKAVKVIDGDKPGVLPSLESVTKGEYPIARALTVYVVGEPEGTLKAYVDFALSEEGQKIVADQGFIPVK